MDEVGPQPARRERRRGAAGEDSRPPRCMRQRSSGAAPIVAIAPADTGT